MLLIPGHVQLPVAICGVRDSIATSAMCPSISLLGKAVITHFEFESDVFPPDDGEEAHINPGCYGRKLADFISNELRSRGYDIGSAIAEDWGWVVPVKNRGFRVWIGCGASEESSNSFLCYISPHQPLLWHVFSRKKVALEIQTLSQSLHEALLGGPIMNLRGITYHQCLTGA